MNVEQLPPNGRSGITASAHLVGSKRHVSLRIHTIGVRLNRPVKTVVYEGQQISAINGSDDTHDASPSS